MSNSLSTMGLPQLRVSSSASIAAFLRTRSAIAKRMRPRCWAVVAFQGPRSKASRAAWIAASTSGLVAAANAAIEEDFDPAVRRGNDFRQNPQRWRDGVELASTVVGYDDSVRTLVDGDARIVAGVHTLHHDRTAP